MQKKIEDLLSDDVVLCEDEIARKVISVDKGIMDKYPRMAVLFEGMGGKWMFFDKGDLVTVVNSKNG